MTFVTLFFLKTFLNKLDNKIKYLQRYEYRHKKYRARRIGNSNCEDEGIDDNVEDVGDVVSAIIPSNNHMEMDVEMDSPSSISSLLFQSGIFDTQELDNIFINDMEKVFFKAWRQLNLGEDVMKAYIDFCTHRGELDPQFFSCANMQFRYEQLEFIVLHKKKIFLNFSKKFLNFITDYDVINLPTKKLYNAIRKNLATAQSLIYVFQFNQPCWEQELRLGSGDQDWEQWQVSFKEKIWSPQIIFLAEFMFKLDWGSIRSSQGDDLSTPYRLTLFIHHYTIQSMVCNASLYSLHSAL